MRGRGLPWSEIEAEWRERRQKGKVNLSKLSRDFDCTPALIRARIKRYAWESPNERAIMERTRALPGQAVIGYKGNPETVGKILDGLEAGNNYATSCALAGVNYTTFKKWREADTEFDAMINESLARSAQKNLNRIDNLRLEGGGKTAQCQPSHQRRLFTEQARRRGNDQRSDQYPTSRRHGTELWRDCYRNNRIRRSSINIMSVSQRVSLALP